MNYLFTIFTPCYNGAKTIERVFSSVAAQTYSNFEWIIINDGSSDNTEEVIKNLKKKYSSIAGKIIYVSQENAGKHVAWNKGVKMAKGDFFLSADSDDSFLPNTLEFFNTSANTLCKDDFLNSSFSGINVCCYNPQTNQIVGQPYPSNVMVSDNLELEYKYHIGGEHWGIVRTDLLRKIEFPQVKGHFYNESYLWFTLAINYKVVCYNQILRAYHYEDTSLIHNKTYKLDKDRSMMELHFTWWKLTHIGKRIFMYSFCGYIKLYLHLLKCLIKVLLSTAKSIVKQ